jgi:hypothetical protein
MIMQPDVVTDELVQRSIPEATKKKPLPAATRLRLDRFGEGLVAQVLHIGPYSAERPTIERLHTFIAEAGYRPCGKHHEIYRPCRREPGRRPGPLATTNGLSSDRRVRAESPVSTRRVRGPGGRRRWRRFRSDDPAPGRWVAQPR